MQLKPTTVIIVLLLVVASLCVSACVTSNTTTSGSNKKDVSSGLSISAKAVSPSPQTMGGSKPQAGNVFVVFDCTVKNTGAAGVDIKAYYWHLKSATGYYDGMDKLPVVAPEFSNIENSAVGDVGSGYVYFQVPSASANGPWTSLRYTNEGIYSVLSNETFDLSVNV